MSSAADLSEKRRAVREQLAEVIRDLRTRHADSEVDWVREDVLRVLSAINSDYVLTTFVCAVTGVFAERHPEQIHPVVRTMASAK